MSRFLEGMMPQTDSVFGLVETDLQAKRHSSAMMKLIKISREHSHDPVFLGLLARTQRALCDFRGLIKTLEVKARVTGAGEDHLQLMLALYGEGRLNEALDVGLMLQETGLPPAGYRELGRTLIRIYLEFSDYEGVREAAAGLSPDDFTLWALGLACLADGDKSAALANFREAVILNAANDQAWVSLAMLHEEMGDRELALANLESALDVNAQNATALKLMTKWHNRAPEQTEIVKGKVSYYLSRHAFDEEISLCYVQLLQESRDAAPASFEIEKLILQNPENTFYREMKKNLQDSFKMC